MSLNARLIESWIWLGSIVSAHPRVRYERQGGIENSFRSVACRVSREFGSAEVKVLSRPSPSRQR